MKKSNKEKYAIEFSSIENLIHKVDILKAAHKTQSIISERILKENSIPFSRIDDYHVMIDMKLLTKKEIGIINNQDASFINDVYKKLKIKSL